MVRNRVVRAPSPSKTLISACCTEKSKPVKGTGVCVCGEGMGKRNIRFLGISNFNNRKKMWKEELSTVTTKWLSKSYHFRQEKKDTPTVETTAEFFLDMGTLSGLGEFFWNYYYFKVFQKKYFPCRNKIIYLKFQQHFLCVCNEIFLTFFLRSQDPQTPNQSVFFSLRNGSY